MTKDNMDYKKIPTVLKRYSFQSKMDISFRHSRLIMNSSSVNLHLVSKGYSAPWELETFTMMSVVAEEWKNDNFAFPQDKCFKKIIESIRNYAHPQIEGDSNPKTRSYHYLMATGLVQFDIQKNILPKIFRYWYIFNFKNDYLDMPKLFKAKFQCNFDEFAEFALSLWTCFTSSNLPMLSYLIENINKKWAIPLNALTITRSDYIKELNGITSQIEDYIYCLRPSYSFPFIEHNGEIYLPLPHVLVRAVTSSLLFRLTDNNDSLQQAIGKNVLEHYLYELILDQDFDEVLSEQQYCFGKNNDQKTADVMARRGQFILFLDSKSFSPKRNIRLIDADSISGDIDRLAKGCVQMYKQLRHNFQIKYNCFEDPIDIPMDNRYGLVVVKELPHFMLEEIYTEVASRLKIDYGSTEYTWLCLHIGVVEIDDIENYCFVHSDLLESLIERNHRNSLYDHFLMDNHTDQSVSYKPYSDYCDKLLESVRDAMCEVIVGSS